MLLGEDGNSGMIQIYIFPMVFGPARAPVSPSLVSGLVLVVRVCFGRNAGLVPS